MKSLVPWFELFEPFFALSIKKWHFGFQGHIDLLSSLASTSEPRKKKRKVEPVKDEENYISYRPSDYNSEMGYVWIDCESHQDKVSVVET